MNEEPSSTTYVPGNPTCEDVYGPGTLSIGVDRYRSGTYWGVGGASVTVDVIDRAAFGWSSSVPLLGVIVKAGPGANLYPAAGATSGEGLVTPGCKDVSHLLFCYAPPVT